MTHDEPAFHQRDSDRADVTGLDHLAARRIASQPIAAPRDTSAIQRYVRSTLSRNWLLLAVVTGLTGILMLVAAHYWVMAQMFAAEAVDALRANPGSLSANLYALGLMFALPLSVGVAQVGITVVLYRRQRDAFTTFRQTTRERFRASFVVIMQFVFLASVVRFVMSGFPSTTSTLSAMTRFSESGVWKLLRQQ